MTKSEAPSRGVSRRRLLQGAAATMPLLGLSAIHLDIRAALAATPGDTLVVDIGNDINSFDPDHYTNWNDYWAYGNMFEGLYRADENGDLVPALVESYELSEDGKTYTFTLREGVKFHNGDPLTADDIIFSLDRTLAPETKNQRRTLLGANLESYAKVDDRHFTMKLKAVDAETVAKFSLYWQVKPKKYIESVGDEGFAAHPVGTGPYSFVEYKPAQHFKMAAFDGYWGEKPKVANVLVNIVPEEQSRLAQVMAGEADVATPISPVIAARLTDAPNVDVVRVPSLLNIVLFFSTLHPETAKKEVRQALSFALDREGMRKSIMLGYASPQELWCTEAQPGCDTTGVEPYNYDPDRARALLKQANYDASTPLKFLGQAPGRVAASKETCEAIVEYWKQVGVNVELTLLEFGAWNAIKTAEPKDPSWACIYATAPDPSKDVAYKLAVNTNSKVRSAYVFDPDNDAMLAKMNAFTDPEERKAYLTQIMRNLHDQAYILPLWANDAIYVTAKGIDFKVPAYMSFTMLEGVAKTS